MKKNLILMVALLIVCSFGGRSVSAQLTITIPKIPKINKPKKEQPRAEMPKTDDNQSKTTQTTASKPVVMRDKCSESRWLERHLEEIAKRQQEVDSFTPERGWFTKNFTYDHLLNAVSLSAREKWLKDSDALQFKDCPNLVSAFDALAASAAKKLPLYQANPKAYNFRNAADEKLMKAELENPATLKIYKIGLNQSNWLISKDNFDLPTSRYKHGMIWARNPADDHAFCKFYYVNIIQDYAGGGTYGASHATFIESRIVSCPANTK